MWLPKQITNVSSGCTSVIKGFLAFLQQNKVYFVKTWRFEWVSGRYWLVESETLLLFYLLLFQLKGWVRCANYLRCFGYVCFFDQIYTFFSCFFNECVSVVIFFLLYVLLLRLCEHLLPESSPQVKRDVFLCYTL